MRRATAELIVKDPNKFAHHDRVFLNNPVVMQGMGLAPLVVLATSGQNAVMLAAAVALLLVPSRVLACLLSRLVPLHDEDPAPETLQKKLLPRALVYGFSTAVVYLAVYPILNMLFSTSLLSLGIYLPLLTALRELGPDADGRMPQGSPVPAITCRIRRMHENMQRTRLALEESHENLRQNLRQTEKMALVGKLAAGVAHEIRNPLSSIKGYATYFGMRFPEGSEDRKAAGVMVREVERLNRVISELIGLSRPSDVRPVAAPLEDSVAHVLRLIAQDAEKRGVRLVNSLPAALPPARMDPDRLGQALLNICLNALDAMPDGGTLTLGCTVEKQHLVLSVTDTGQGIAPENLNHIFDPYFTTKGHGTGLGLATVHKRRSKAKSMCNPVRPRRTRPAGPRFSYACRRPARQRAIRRTARTGRRGSLPTGRRGRIR